MNGEEQVTLKDKYFGVSIDKDIYGNNMVDGEWHTFEYIYEYDGTFATSKIDNVTYTNYIKDTVTSQMYFRPMGNSPLGKPAGSPSENFTQEYIDACSAAGTTPYVDCLLDNFSVMPYSGMLTDGGSVDMSRTYTTALKTTAGKRIPIKPIFRGVTPIPMRRCLRTCRRLWLKRRNPLSSLPIRERQGTRLWT